MSSRVVCSMSLPVHPLGATCAGTGHGMGSTWEPACITSGQLKRNSGGTLKGHTESQHFQRQLENDLHLKRKRKTKKDTQTMFLCKKGTILLRSLFHTLDGLGRALIKGSIEGLNMNLSSFRRNANLWKLAEHCITCRWDTQLLPEEHVLQCSRRSSPS